MAVKVGPFGRAVGLDNSETMITEAKNRAKDLGSNIEIPYRQCNEPTLLRQHVQCYKM
jgi:ubiquinone/menaquinone biosynthesis C-methylase UbiE